MTSTKRPRVLARAAVVVALAIAVPALAQQAPVVHEFIPFDPTAESELGVVTTEGGFDVEKITSSGKITAPDPGRPITEKTPLYSNKSSVPEKYSPDRDTRRVDHLPYDDPFRPRLAPFKRLMAFDAVDTDYTLKTSSALHSKVNVGAEKLRSGVHPDIFYADVAVDLVAGEPIRVPSAVGGNIIKKAHLNPGVTFKLERDIAENLFIVADGSGRARLIMELEAPNEAFGGAERQADWKDLASAMTAKLPANVQKAADEFARELKIDKSIHAPYEAVRILVRYFREFKESEDPPPNTGDIYLDLVRAKKGVCRHRAFGFMVTALGLGIPTRFVNNEAHAWVEQWDGTYWRRIDLGGAGRILDDKTERPEKPQPAYDPPLDPYNWPAGATKGSDLIPPSTPTPSPTNTGGTSPIPVPTPTGSSSASPPSTAPPSKVTLALPGSPSEGDLEILRTRSFQVKGRVLDSAGAACKSVRVEIVLSGAEKEHTVGAMPTDADGNYEGQVNIPSTVDLGSYTVLARTPGHGTCGQGKSE